MAFRKFSKEEAVKEARRFNHNAVFSAQMGSYPITTEILRKRRDDWMRVARGEISHVFYA